MLKSFKHLDYFFNSLKNINNNLSRLDLIMFVRTLCIKGYINKVTFKFYANLKISLGLV